MTGGPATSRCASSGASVAMSLRLGLRISQRGHVGGSRPGVQFLQQTIVEMSFLGLGLALRVLALRVLLIAEDNRLGRAGCLSSRLNLAVPPRPPLVLCIYLAPA